MPKSLAINFFHSSMSSPAICGELASSFLSWCGDVIFLRTGSRIRYSMSPTSSIAVYVLAERRRCGEDRRWRRRYS
jgi:hypothetical protein